MKNRSYVITGASSYLGKALASYLCKGDNKVLLASRRVCEELEGLKSNNVEYLPNINLVEEKDLNVLRKECCRFFQCGFHVINCVGFFPDYIPIEKMRLEDARKVLDSNILSVFGVANKLLPLMSNQGGCHFIGFSMHTAYQNYPYMAIFSAAKLALESFIKSVSNEYLHNEVYANVVSLATLRTETEKRIKPYGDYENWLEADEVCNIVDNLIRYSNGLVNGSVIHAYKYSKTFFGESYLNRIKK